MTLALILNLLEIKSDFNLKMMNFNIDFTVHSPAQSTSAIIPFDSYNPGTIKDMLNNYFDINLR